jgi:hypothetical protein
LELLSCIDESRSDTFSASHIQRQTILTTVAGNYFKKRLSKIGQLSLADTADAEKRAR